VILLYCLVVQGTHDVLFSEQIEKSQVVHLHLGIIQGNEMTNRL